MKITILGCGYVGLTTGACLAQLGNTVTCIEINKDKLRKLKEGQCPIFEPGLQELIQNNLKSKRLSFTGEATSAVKKSKVVFIAVGTPSLADGRADLSQVEKAATQIGQAMNSYKAIVNKSTVPIGTGDLVIQIISHYYKGEFDVVSNPEFLREGSAIQDFMQPERIVIGNGNHKVRKIMGEIYKSLDCPVIYTDVKTAEMIKYASNAFLATQISFINSIARICEQVGADVTKVAEGMKLDGRIGKKAFLNAGLGYGGSCFPKDIRALIQIAQENNNSFEILEAVEATNETQKISVVGKLKKILNNNLKGKTIALWGLSFKPKTDDMREAPSLTIVHALQEYGAKIRAYDPVARENARKILTGVEFCHTPYEAVKGAEALVIVTGWEEFIGVDKQKVKKLLKSPNVIDGRNIWNPAEAKKMGFNYLGVGR